VPFTFDDVETRPSQVVERVGATLARADRDGC
jgi:hypothetical protein